MIKLKQNLYKTYFFNGNESDKQYLKKLANKLIRMKTQAKRVIFSPLLLLLKNLLLV